MVHGQSSFSSPSSPSSSALWRTLVAPAERKGERKGSAQARKRLHHLDNSSSSSSGSVSTVPGAKTGAGTGVIGTAALVKQHQQGQQQQQSVEGDSGGDGDGESGADRERRQAWQHAVCGGLALAAAAIVRVLIFKI